MRSSSLLLTLKLPLLLLSAGSRGEDTEGARLRPSPELSHTWVLAPAWWYQDALPTGTKQEATPPVSTSDAQGNWSRDRPGVPRQEGQKLVPPPSQPSPGYTSKSILCDNAASSSPSPFLYSSPSHAAVICVFMVNHFAVNLHLLSHWVTEAGSLLLSK